MVFENEKGFHQTLINGDYIRIEPVVNHWVKGVQNSQLLLTKSPSHQVSKSPSPLHINMWMRTLCIRRNFVT